MTLAQTPAEQPPGEDSPATEDRGVHSDLFDFLLQGLVPAIDPRSDLGGSTSGEAGVPADEAAVFAHAGARMLPLEAFAWSAGRQDRSEVDARGGTASFVDTAILPTLSAASSHLPGPEASVALAANGDSQGTGTASSLTGASVDVPHLARGESSMGVPAFTAPGLSPAQVADPLWPEPRALSAIAGSVAWFDELGRGLSWQVGEGLSEARLRLNPAELGSLDVQVRVTERGTEVHFVAPHPQARELLEQGLTRLRESLEQQGLQFADASVSDGRAKHGRQGSRDESAQDLPRSAWPGDRVIEALPVDARMTRSGLVDLYA
jgi:flagellar hook-length control protein FliK